jgi:type VI secretion system protein VasI
MKLFRFLFLSIFSLNAFSEVKIDIAKCAVKETDAARLICYDSLAKSLGVDGPEIKSTSGSGKWHSREEKSRIDDSVNVHLVFFSNEPVKSGYKTVKPTLHVMCVENQTNVYISWELYLGLEETQMLTRFDKEKAKTTAWSLSTDNKAVFYRGSAVEFAKNIMQHQSLLLQITPYGESPVMATFDVSGLTEAIKPLRQACQW